MAAEQLRDVEAIIHDPGNTYAERGVEKRLGPLKHVFYGSTTPDRTGTLKRGIQNLATNYLFNWFHLLPSS